MIRSDFVNKKISLLYFTDSRGLNLSGFVTYSPTYQRQINILMYHIFTVTSKKDTRVQSAESLGIS